MTGDIESDVVVLGGGIAGLVAAARASELGLNVTVLERGTTTDYPCNARWSGGVFHIAYNDITGSRDELRQIIERDTAGRGDSAQAETLVANGTRFISWLRENDTTFVSTSVNWQQFILEPMRDMRAGLDWQARGPDQLMQRLTGKIERNGGSVLLGARGRELVMTDGRCAGIRAEVGGKQRTFLASAAVVLADGGFQGNIELLGSYIAPKPELIKQRGAANGTGDALLMASAVGAELAGMDRFYGHLLSRDALNNDSIWPYPEVDALASAGILVNRNAERFTDEGQGGIAITNALARTADPLGATIVFDAAIWEGPGRSARIPANPTLEAAGGTVLRADTITELAEKAGLPASQLEASIAAYNEALQTGTLARLEPPRTATKHEPMPIIKAPYHAMPVCAGITYTMGGIRIDGQSRVLTPAGTAIVGLYAAGSATGGLEGDGDGIVSYVGGLAKAGIQGLIAAESIAKGRGLKV
jgi:fumarate reductase flavoprotein subunit